MKSSVEKNALFVTPIWCILCFLALSTALWAGASILSVSDAAFWPVSSFLSRSFDFLSQLCHSSSVLLPQLWIQQLLQQGYRYQFIQTFNTISCMAEEAHKIVEAARTYFKAEGGASTEKNSHWGSPFIEWVIAANILLYSLLGWLDHCKLVLQIARVFHSTLYGTWWFSQVWASAWKWGMDQCKKG